MDKDVGELLVSASDGAPCDDGGGNYSNDLIITPHTHTLRETETEEKNLN